MADMNPIINPSTLTEEQREAIKETYKSLCRKTSNTELPSDYRDCATAQMMILESIFGTELFAN